MISEVSEEKPYKVPLNILICNLTNDNSDLLRLVLGEAYLKLKRKELRDGDVSFVHQEWKWLFTPTELGDISSKLEYYSKQSAPEMKNTMLLVKTVSIMHSQTVVKLFDQIVNLPPDNQPMTLFITDVKEETEEGLRSMIKSKARIDGLSFFVLNNLGDKDEEKARLQKMVYVQFYRICSYYNQLGDQFIFSKDMEEIAPGQVFTQRFNIIIVGRPGSGKSTFINKMLGEKRCLVGGGMSKTCKIMQYHHSNHPISFYDTPGFETEKDIIKAIEAINSLNTEFHNRVKQIHLILYLVNAQSRNILNVDIEFLQQFQQWKEKNNQSKTPFVYLITKSKTKANGKEKTVLLDYSVKDNPKFPHYEGIFPIEMSDIYQVDLPFGIKEFMKYLYGYFSPKKFSHDLIEQYKICKMEEEFYELNRKTHFLSEMTSKEIILKQCKAIAWTIVGGTSLIAGGGGFIPIPFADLAVVLPTQIAMIGSISLVYSIIREAKEIRQWLSSFLTGGGLFILAGKVVSNSLKCIPGIGTLAGGFIDSGINICTTFSIGSAAIHFCEKSFDVEKLRAWCLKGIDDYNSAVESFKELSSHFEQTETAVEEENINNYESD